MAEKKAGFNLSQLRNLQNLGKNVNSGRINTMKSVPIDAVVSKVQVRKQFKDLEELADSIHEIGLQVPINVTQADDKGKYTIIQGERRWRAAKMAGLKEIDVIVRESPKTEAKRIVMQLAENIQRDDMNPFDIAYAMKELMTVGLKRVDIAKQLGKSASYVGRLISLTEMPQALKDFIEEKEIRSADVMIPIGESYKKYGEEFFDELKKVDEIRRSKLREIAEMLDKRHAPKPEVTDKEDDTEETDEPEEKEVKIVKPKRVTKEALPEGATYVDTQHRVVAAVAVELENGEPATGYVHPDALCEEADKVCVVVDGRTHIVAIDDLVMTGTKVI